MEKKKKKSEAVEADLGKDEHLRFESHAFICLETQRDKTPKVSLLSWITLHPPPPTPPPLLTAFNISDARFQVTVAILCTHISLGS